MIDVDPQEIHIKGQLPGGPIISNVTNHPYNLGNGTKITIVRDLQKVEEVRKI